MIMFMTILEIVRHKPITEYQAYEIYKGLHDLKIDSFFSLKENP